MWERKVYFLDSRNNNFDFIRLVGALLVLFGHSYALTGHGPTPLQEISNGQIYEGTLGVYFFFVVSGYLITRSFERKKNAIGFIKARFLRIVPGVAVVTLITVFILGPLVTSLPIDEYFSTSRTWTYLKNMFPKSIQFALPGVFLHNSHGPNGSLWTLPVEIRCYVAVFIFGMIGSFKYRFIFVVLQLLFILCYLNVLPFRFEEEAKYLCLMSFLSGGILYLYREKIIFSWKFALISVIGLYVCTKFMILSLGFLFFGSYLLLYFANFNLVKTYKFITTDISYGLYIYAFPIQQLLIHINKGKMGAIEIFGYHCR